MSEIKTLVYDEIFNERETDKAFCFRFGHRIEYMPKSQVEDIRETAKELDTWDWLVDAKNLEGFLK